MTRSARSAADAVREHGNSSRRASEDIEQLRRRLGELGGSFGSLGGSIRGVPMPVLIGAVLLLASILPGIIAGIFALGAALVGVAAAAGVMALGARGLGQAFDGLGRTLQPLKRQLDSVFRAELSQEMIKLGQTISSELAPAFKMVASAISDVIKETSQWIRSAEGIQTIKTLMGGVTDLVRELAPAVKGVVQIFVEFGAAAAPAMGKIGQAISEVITGLRDMFREAQKSGQLQKIFEAGAEAIKGFGEIVKGLMMILMEMADQGGLPAAEAMKQFGKALQQAAPAIGALFANLARAAEIIAHVIEVASRFGDVLGDIINPIRALQREFPKATKDMESFTKGFQKIAGAIPAAAKEIDKFAQTMKKGFDKIVQDVKKGIDKVASDIKAGFDKANQAVKQAIDKINQSIKQGWDKAVQTVKQAVDKLAAAVKQGFDKANQEIKQAVDRIIQAVKEWWEKTVQAVKEGVDKVVEAVKGMVEKLVDAVKELPQKFEQAGKDMVQGIIKGAASMAAALIKTFEDMAKRALAALKAAMGISSPSKVFADEVGVWIPAGIAQGITAGTPALQAALARSMRTLPTTANVALAGAAGRGAAIGLGAGTGKQVIEVKLSTGSGGDGAVGTMIGGLARRGQLKITANAVVGGR
jgi:phage-related protein